jgi:sec-independent protein translocase protein TatC
VNQTFINHVHELRRRLSWSALVLFIGAGVGYIFRIQILVWLQAPLHSQLYYGRVTGAFEFVMQICFFVGLCLSLPMLVYQMIAFIRPALPRPVSNRLVLLVVCSSCMLTVGGVAFAYYLTLPAVLHFLRSMAGDQLNAIIMADSYLNFVITYLGIFAVIFQLPLIMLFIDRITPLTPKRLGKWRKWIVIGSFAAGIILPITPDPLSQIMLALPVIVLYEVSIWLIWGLRRIQAGRSDSTAAEVAEPQTSGGDQLVPPIASRAGVQHAMRRAMPDKQTAPRYPVDTRPSQPVGSRALGANVIDLRNL